MKHAHRRVIVLTSLVSVLTLTSALLLALEPAPLTPDIAGLLAVDVAPPSMDVIFQTEAPTRAARWKYIYIHHSKSASGNASTLGQSGAGMGDHFVIGNGKGAIDGEIQIGPRWTKQQPALPPAGAANIDPNCISICLVGDFDRTVPTPTQLSRLQQLVGTLQGRLRVPASHVLQIAEPAGVASSGRYFPISAFREQLLP